MLAIADFASDEGEAWPSIKILAKKARLGERETQYCLRELEEKGEIETLVGQGRNGSNLYRITLGGAIIAPGVNPSAPGRVNSTAPGGAPDCTRGVHSTAPLGVHSTAPKPSVEPSKETSKARTRASARVRGNSSFKPEEAVLPFSSDQFHAAWLEWCKHRAEIRRPLTEASVRGQLRDCQKWGEERAIVSIEKSVSSSWQGLFEPKDNLSKNNTEKPHDQPFRVHI